MLLPGLQTNNRRIKIFLPLFCLFVIYSLPVKAQSTISGKVTDEKGEAIAYATVTLLQWNDSSIITYAITNEEGRYRISASPDTTCRIQVRSLGFLTQTKQVAPRENHATREIDFVMKENTIGLQTVTVKGQMKGIQFKEDTVRYNPKAFTDGSEVVLGDVLNKLPGIEVDQKGNIKAQGEQVKKLLLNGQDFFSGNTQLATKNLPADIAENVEVLNNYSEYSLLKGFQSHEETAINIGVNKEKLGKISGNLSAGGGIEDKYHFKGNLMQIKPKLMTSVIGALNNTGDEVFSIEEYIRLQGGVDEVLGSRGNQSSIELSKEEQNLLMPKNNTFSRRNGLAALNFSYQPEPSLKINSYLLFNGNKEKAKDDNKYTYYLPKNENLITTKQLESNGNNRIYSGYLKLDYQPSPSFSLTYKGNLSNTEMDRTSNITNRMGIQQVDALDRQDAESFSTRHNTTMIKSIGENLLIGNLSFAYSNKPVNYRMNTDSLLLPLPISSIDEWYYGRQNTRLKQTSGDIDLSFLYKINNSFFLRTALHVNITSQSYYSAIYQDIPGLPPVKLTDDSLRNRISPDMYGYSTGLNLIKNKGLVRFKLGASVNCYDLSTGRMKVNDKTTWKLNPQADISLFFSQKHILSVSCSRSDSPVSADAFIQGIVFDSYQAYSHNSQMYNLFSTTYNVNLSYRIFDMFSNTMFILAGGYNKFRHKSTNNYSQDGLLTVYQPIHSPPGKNKFGKLYLSKGLGSIPWTIKLTGSYNNNSFYTQSYGTGNKIKTENTNAKIQLISNYRHLINAECQAAIEYSENQSSIGSGSTQKVQRYAGKLKLNVTRHFFADTGLEYVINDSPGSTRHLYYLNASLRYTFNKNTELELAGVNLFNLHEQNWDMISYNGVYLAKRHFRQIPGNIMLKMNYRF